MKGRWIVGLAVVAIATGSGCSKGSAGDAVDSVKSPHWAGGGLVATELYGPSTVGEGTLEQDEVHKPWSSWWFPNNDDFLFARRGDHMAPLQKYDEYVKRTRGIDPGAADWEAEQYNPALTDAGDGLCNAWSAASILEPEPSQPKTVAGVSFDIVDLKALLIKSYEQLQGKRIFGQVYRDPLVNDFQDIYPEQFHRLLEVTLLAKGQPFVMDTDPGIEVWNTPVSAAIVDIKRDHSDPGVMHVLARLWETLPVKDDADVDFVGQRGFWAEYSYDLVGNPRPDGRIDVVYGVWTNVMDGPIPVNSVRFHPDFVTLLPDSKQLRSRNPNIDPAIVEEILQN